jgi:hypothetical protein
MEEINASLYSENLKRREHLEETGVNERKMYLIDIVLEYGLCTKSI